MKINVNNCEAFFLDYYEGNLSEGQVAEMFTFLKSNPEQREVFESFANMLVDKEESNSPDFSFLKKDAVIDEHEQAEIWMVDLIEENIADEDRIALEKYFVKNPDRRSELALLEKTILRPDENERLDEIGSIKKPVVVTADNFDDFAIAEIENTITREEKELLDVFVSTRPEFKKQLLDYRKTISSSESNVRFDAKESLKKVAVHVSASNIEELLIAKFEGQLASHEEQAVDSFILEHPEYKSELNLLEQTRLVPDDSEVYEAKNTLKRGAIAINEENFEDHVISASEGLLNREELKAFNTYVASNSGNRKTVALYASTKLEPDMTIIYDDKEGLKRKLRGGMFWWTSTIRYAAAIVVVLLGVYLFIKFGGNTIDPQSNDEIVNDGNFRDRDDQLNPFQNDESQRTILNNGNLATNDVPKTNSGNDISHNEVWDIDNGDKKVKATPAPAIEITFAPNKIVAKGISNEANDGVDFSDALYAVVFTPVSNEPQNEYLSPGQIAMRWMKDKIEGSDPEIVQQEIAVDNTLAESKENKNVDGMDLTQSAVNRVGDAAAGGKVSMNQAEDGTYLNLWNYSVRVSEAD